MNKEEQKKDVSKEVLIKLLSNIGGIFIFTGIIVFIGSFWDKLNSAARIIITLGPGIVSYVVALMLEKNTKFQKFITPLFIIAAILIPTGLFVVFDELAHGGDWRIAALVVFGALFLQFLATFWMIRRSVLLFITLGFFYTTMGVLFDLVGLDPKWNETILGLSMLLVAIGLEKTNYREYNPYWYFFGAIMFLFGAFLLLEKTSIELIYILICFSTIFAGTYYKSKTLLIISTLALIVYIIQYSALHFANSLGWPITLIIIGILLFVLGYAILMLNAKYKKQQ